MIDPRTDQLAAAAQTRLRAVLVAVRQDLADGADTAVVIENAALLLADLDRYDASTMLAAALVELARHPNGGAR